MTARPLFGRRQTNAVARVLSETNYNNDRHTRWIIIRDAMMQMFTEDNPNFDIERFKAACDDEPS